MDYKEYWALRGECFITKDVFLDVSENADGNQLSGLAHELRVGYFGYINLDLSIEFVRKALDMDLDSYSKRQAYEILIDDALLKGLPYIGILKEALDDGVIPDRPLRMSEYDMGIIRSNSGNVNDYRSLLNFCWSDRHKTDSYWAERALHALESRMSKGESARVTANDLSTLSSFDCGEDYDKRLLDMADRTLSREDADDQYGLTFFDLHKTLENINGKREDELLIRSAAKGYWGALPEVFLRYPNADESLKGRYVDAINESIRNGKPEYHDLVVRASFDPYSILPEPSVRVLINHLNEQIGLGKIEEDSYKAAEMYLAISKSMFVRGNKEAFRYAVRSLSIDVCPMLYSMLIDGFGTEKDEGLAMKVAEVYEEKDTGLLRSVLSDCKSMEER